MLNKAILMGRLTKDPELRQTKSGVPVAGFSVAVDRNFLKDGERETDFFDVVAWQARAEFVSKYFTKGQPIAIEGRMQQRKREDNEGKPRYSFEIVAESVHFAGFKKPGEDTGASYTDEAFDPFAHEAAA